MIGVGDRDRERGERKEKESTSDKTKQVRLRTAAQSLEQIFQLISRTVNIVPVKMI